MDSNPQRTIAWRALAASAVGLFLMFGPIGFGWLDGFDGGFALATFGLLVLIGGIVTAIIFFRLAGRYDRISSDTSLLAHWTYTDEEWRAYTEAEHKLDTADRWRLAGIISAFALFFGVLFAIFDQEAGVFVLLVMLGLIGLVWFTAFITSRQNYRRNVERKGEALIAGDGILLNGQLHTWNIIGSRLERVDYMEGTPPVVEFEYSAVSRSGRDSFTVRVPVPSRQEDSARDVVRFFSGALAQSPPGIAGSGD